MSFVYFLESEDSCTYIGATKNLDRRLKQHLGFIKGGAKATLKKINQGFTWKRICYVSGFPSWSAALQFEWKWKYLSKKIYNKSPYQRRFLALFQLLCLESSTLNALPYSSWPSFPIIHFEKQEEFDRYSLSFPQNTFNIVVDEKKVPN